MLLLMESERRMTAGDSSGGGCSRALAAVVMLSIQLVAAAHRPGFQQGQTAMLIAAHQFLTRRMAFAFPRFPSMQQRRSEADRARKSF